MSTNKVKRIEVSVGTFRSYCCSLLAITYNVSYVSMFSYRCSRFYFGSTLSTYLCYSTFWWENWNLNLWNNFSWCQINWSHSQLNYIKVVNAYSLRQSPTANSCHAACPPPSFVHMWVNIVPFYYFCRFLTGSLIKPLSPSARISLWLSYWPDVLHAKSAKELSYYSISCYSLHS